MKTLAAMLAAMLVAVGLSVATPSQAQALSGSEFDPNYIISDANFYDGNAMTEAQIQQFLQAKVPSCTNGLCLTQFRQDTTARAADAYCSAYTPAASERASTIIFKIQQACGVSAKAILVTLQKEQSLVTTVNPTLNQLRIAMGYGCPDTGAGCDAAYYGFQNQVYMAARQFQRYKAAPSNYNFAAGRTRAVQFHPNTACGSAVLTPRNAATAALYNYTPYQPNAAALANLYGTGDGCSSYGNRNFWRTYNDWFGTSTGYETPVGTWDYTQVGVSSTTLSGWVFDPETADPIDVHLYVNGTWGGSTTANLPRADVGAGYPSYGPNHGFAFNFGTGQGPFQVCLYGINVGRGIDLMLGCRNLATPTGPPFGDYNGLTRTGLRTASVTGWAVDTDTPSPINVVVSVNGVDAAPVAANGTRDDVAAAYPGYGSAHGFNVPVTLQGGANRVCVRAVNVGEGSDMSLGCRDVSVPTGSPYGDLNAVTASLGEVRLQGWVIDPDTTDPVSLNFTVNGATVGPYSASLDRGDIAAAFPMYGGAHGFDVRVPTSTSTTTVCAYTINVGGGGESSLGCRTVSAPGGPPIGGVRSGAVNAGVATVAGWAIDPDTTTPVTLHAYVNGGWGGSFVANVADAETAAAYPAYGANHGFSVQVPVGSGTNQVCIYGINQGSGYNSLVGCRTFSTAAGPPFGDINWFSGAAGVASFGGWIIDPDVSSPVTIHAYVNGAWGGSFVADGTRDDVAAVYPAYGAQHGFGIQVPVPPGNSNVCLYGINQGVGYNSLLGCRTVSSPSGPPFGDLNSVGVSAGVATLQGWVIDRDVTSPVDVHVYVNGQWGGSYVANVTRNDVGAAFPAYGSQHGFVIQVPVPAGANQICAYGINQGAGYNVLIGCRTAS